MYRSTNNGTNWEVISYNKSVQAFAVYNNNIFWGCVSGGVSVSTDNGTSWSEVNNGLPDYVHNDVIGMGWSYRNITSLGVYGTHLFASYVSSGIWQRSISEMVNITPNILVSNYFISQNYPNPFNPVTNINYSIPKSGMVTIKIYDILGREIKTLVNSEIAPGNYTVQFNGVNLASGIYIYRMQCGNFVQSKKLLLLK